MEAFGVLPACQEAAAAHYESLRPASFLLHPADPGYSRGRGSMAEQNNPLLLSYPSHPDRLHFIRPTALYWAGIYYFPWVA